MTRKTPGYVAEHLKIEADGVYVDGNRIPVTDEVTVETIDDDFHIATVRLLVAQVHISDSHRISKTEGATYRHVQQPETVTD